MKNEYADLFNVRGHLYNEAVSSCPLARENERAALLDLIGDAAGRTVIDIPAGGGYVADGIQARWPSASVICNEPAQRFAAAIQPCFTIRHDPMDSLGLADGSIDIIASLAGLHHVGNRLPLFREWKRVLRPGAMVAVADVMADSPTAAFLNEFVHANTPGGHEGVFFSPGEFTANLIDSGFAHVTERLIEVPWIFPNVKVMGRFCRTLFAATKATEEEVIEGIRHHLGWQEIESGIAMNWALIYASGVVPV